MLHPLLRHRSYFNSCDLSILSPPRAMSKLVLEEVPAERHRCDFRRDFIRTPVPLQHIRRHSSVHPAVESRPRPKHRQRRTALLVRARSVTGTATKLGIWLK